VQLYFIHNHLKKTREAIQLEDIPEEMYGGTLPVAKGRKSRKRALTEAEYLDDDAALEKALQLEKEIEVPAESLAKESTVEAGQLGIELTENLQQMAVANDMVKATEVV